MQPSMVLDRTMFNLYCSTTWLDQAQRKTPWTARVRVRQRQREKSVERKQHGEAQAEGSRRVALHSTHAKRWWIQEVILYATTAGTPWSTMGVSVHKQSPGGFRDRTDTTENTTKGCKQLLPARMCSFHHTLSAQHTLLFISYLLSPGVSFQYKYHSGLLHLFKCNLRNTAAHIRNSGFWADGQALAVSASQATFEPDSSSQWPFTLVALTLTNCNYHCFAFVWGFWFFCLFFISSALYSKVADTRLKTHKGKQAYFVTILLLGTVLVEICTSFVDGSLLSFWQPGLFHTVLLAVTRFCNFDR